MKLGEGGQGRIGRKIIPTETFKKNEYKMSSIC